MTKELVEMLGYCRPAFSKTEEDFIDKYLRPLGIQTDSYGNIWKDVGENPNILWSSHTDTVHSKEGIVPIFVDGSIARVHPMHDATCLGADCTTGVWIMMEMIRAEVAGTYVFHRAEEQGMLGSTYIHDHHPDWLKDYDACIAFDRYGFDSIITHQCSSRGCSEAFAASMIEQLPGYQTDEGGVFTDSYAYFDNISECTNISVGYKSQHTRSETQDLDFAQHLRDLMVNFESSKLVFERDPSVEEYLYSSNFKHPGRSFWYDDDYYYKPPKSMCQLVREHPQAAADLLELYGVSRKELESHIGGTHSFYGS